MAVENEARAPRQRRKLLLISEVGNEDLLFRSCTYLHCDYTQRSARLDGDDVASGELDQAGKNKIEGKNAAIVQQAGGSDKFVFSYAVGSTPPRDISDCQESRLRRRASFIAINARRGQAGPAD